MNNECVITRFVYLLKFYFVWKFLLYFFRIVSEIFIIKIQEKIPDFKEILSRKKLFESISYLSIWERVVDWSNDLSAYIKMKQFKYFLFFKRIHQNKITRKKFKFQKKTNLNTHLQKKIDLNRNYYENKYISTI